MSEHELYAWILSLGWTLIHFLWQGGLIALALAAILALTRERSSSERYLIRCGALVMMALAPVATFVVVRGDAPAAPSVPAIALGTDSAQGVQEELVGSPWFSWLAAGDLFSWIVVLWTLGAAGCSLRLAGGLLQVLRLRRRAVGINLAPRWQQRFDSLARDFGVRARGRVVECASVAVPTVIGWVKPVVLLPARIFTGLTDEQIEALIAHELAHVSRHDYLVNFLQSILEALLFYHPAVWWVSRGIRVEREYCCDDRAVAATHDGLSYARALTALETWRGGEPQLGVSTLGGSLMQRIQRLVGGKPVAKPGPVRPFHALAALALVGSMGASAFGLAALPDASPDGDCPCPCHQKQKQAPPPKAEHVVRWNTARTLPEVDPQDEEGARRAWIRFGDEKDLLLDVAQKTADADHLLQSVADLKAQIAALEMQLAELTDAREKLDPRELLNRAHEHEEQGETRDFWTTQKRSRRPGQKGLDPKVERYWRVREERQAKDRRQERIWVEGSRIPERLLKIQFQEQAEQAKKGRDQALKHAEEARRYIELKAQYDAKSGKLEINPDLKELEFYWQKVQDSEGEAPPPEKQAFLNRYFHTTDPEAQAIFEVHGDEGEAPGYYLFEGSPDGEYFLNRTQRVQADPNHALSPEALEQIRVQVIEALEPLKNLELEGVDFGDYEIELEFGDFDFEDIKLDGVDFEEHEFEGYNLDELWKLKRLGRLKGGLGKGEALKGIGSIKVGEFKGPTKPEVLDLLRLKEVNLEKLKDVQVHLDLLRHVEDIEIDGTLGKLLEDEDVEENVIKVLKAKDWKRVVEEHQKKKPD